jgi:hypothetical protein
MAARSPRKRLAAPRRLPRTAVIGVPDSPHERGGASRFLVIARSHEIQSPRFDKTLGSEGVITHDRRSKRRDR